MSGASMNPGVPAEAATSASGGGGRPRFADLAGEAIRYWERRRLLYDPALLAVVLAHFIASWPGSMMMLRRDPLLMLFGLAVLANVAYCAAYAVDLFVQFSGARASWMRWRWTVLLVGTAFAAVLAHFCTLGLLAGA